jgi:hypothetical protein
LRARKLGQQLEDLRLHGDVERGRRFVGQEQRRLAQQRHGDHHALAHAAREFMRIEPNAPPRLGDAHALEHAHGDIQRLAAADAAVSGQHLRQLVPDAHVGIQGRHRVLEDHGHFRAAHGVEIARAAVQDLAALKLHAAGRPAVGGQEPHDGEQDLALAGAGLADDAHDLAAPQLETHAIDGRHPALRQLEADGEIADRQDRRRRGGLSARWGRKHRAGRR